MYSQNPPKEHKNKHNKPVRPALISAKHPKKARRDRSSLPVTVFALFTLTFCTRSLTVVFVVDRLLATKKSHFGASPSLLCTFCGNCHVVTRSRPEPCTIHARSALTDHRLIHCWNCSSRNHHQTPPQHHFFGLLHRSDTHFCWQINKISHQERAWPVCTVQSLNRDWRTERESKRIYIFLSFI